MAVEHGMSIAQPLSLPQLLPYDNYVTNYSLPVITCTGVPSDVLKPKPCDSNEKAGVWFRPGISVSHVLEVLSVKIFNKKHDFNDIEIYGQIAISDFLHDNDNFTCIYNKDSDDPDTLSRTHNVLSLSGNNLIRPFMNAKVLFNFTNKETGVPVFDSEVCVIDYDYYGEYKQESLTVQGNDGYYATMEYCTIPFATIAQVSMYLTTRPQPDPVNIMNVDGDIKANGLSILGKKDLNRSMHLVDEPTYFVCLSRKSLAVAVESWLEFQVSLQHGGTDFISGKVVADLKHTYEGSSMFIDSKDKKYRLHIDVEFVLPDEYFGLLPKVDHHRFKSETYYVEVFSVVVGVQWRHIPALYGKILVRDQVDSFYIFSREEDRPYNFSEENYPASIISLAWPDNWLVQAEGFVFNILLQDIQGKEVCYGGFDLEKQHRLQFDKRMCSFIQTEDGYFAAVHYSIFKDCRKAKVTFEWEGELSLVVHGNVSVKYGNCQYGKYDDKYYQNIIFKRFKEDRVVVKSRSSVPLSKSLITTPSECDHLYVNVSLTAQVDNVTYPRIKKKLLFKLGSTSDSSHQIYVNRKNQCTGRLIATVNWS